MNIRQGTRKKKNCASATCEALDSHTYFNVAGLSFLFSGCSFVTAKCSHSKVPATAFPHPPACGAVTPRCSSAFLHQQIMDGASAVHHLRKGFRLRRGSAITFFSRYASFSSLSINNSLECPPAAREKKVFMRLPIWRLLVNTVLSVCFRMKLSDRFNWGNLQETRRKSHFQDGTRARTYIHTHISQYLVLMLLW